MMKKFQILLLFLTILVHFSLCGPPTNKATESAKDQDEEDDNGLLDGRSADGDEKDHSGPSESGGQGFASKLGSFGGGLARTATRLLALQVAGFGAASAARSQGNQWNGSSNGTSLSELNYALPTNSPAMPVNSELDRGNTTNSNMAQGRKLASCDCPAKWQKYDGSLCFSIQIASNPVTFGQASMACQKMGSELTSIHSYAEHIFIQKYIKTNNGGHTRFWIGLLLSWGPVEGHFTGSRWTDGTPMDFGEDMPLWAKGEPSGPKTRGATRTCGFIRRTPNPKYGGVSWEASWEDAECDDATDVFSFICRRNAIKC